MGSVYSLDIALRLEGDEAKATEIVATLGGPPQVRDIGGNAWKADYADFEDRAAAVRALAADLSRIDEHWDAHLQIG